MAIRVAVLFQRYGPYHWARLRGAVQHLDAVGVQVYQNDNTYAWEKASARDLPSVTVFPEAVAEDVSASNVWSSVSTVLSTLSPDAVAIHGWVLPSALAALDWCIASGTPAIVMSESTPHDFERTRWKEAIKQILVRSFQAGLVGGSLHVDYLSDLGIPPERVLTGYDAVDNDHFIHGSNSARENAHARRSTLDLPQDYFLASNRFIPKKNLPRLLKAYREYVNIRGKKAWHLVLLGDGPLWDEIVALCATLGIQEYVHMPGFKQYDALPSYYGLARAFVHASTTEQWGLVVNEALASGLPVLVSSRCGCALDLVVEGQNGYTFNPYHIDDMSTKLLKLDSPSSNLEKMGAAGRDRVKEWGPNRFGRGLARAAETALSVPSPSYAELRRLLLQIVMRT